MVLAACSLAAVLTAPAVAQPPDESAEATSLGFFYGTFGQDPNIVLLVGGTAEQFCDANPEDPFNGEPGSAVSRTRFGSDGSVTITVHDWAQPVHLYRTPIEGAPVWIEQVCAAYFSGGQVQQPLASGLALVRARTTVVSENQIEIFNSARGWARGVDGTHYRVVGSAEFTVVNGAPDGDPADFIDLRLTALGRH